MADLEEAAKTCQKGAAGEAPQNHVLAGGQRTAGAEAVTWGLPFRGGAAAQQERQGKRIIPPVVGRESIGNRGISPLPVRHSGWERRGRLAGECSQDRKKKWD